LFYLTGGNVTTVIEIVVFLKHDCTNDPIAGKDAISEWHFYVKEGQIVPALTTAECGHCGWEMLDDKEEFQDDLERFLFQLSETVSWEQDEKPFTCKSDKEPDPNLT
jgi:hypothetical protein